MKRKKYEKVTDSTRVIDCIRETFKTAHIISEELSIPKESVRVYLSNLAEKIQKKKIDNRTCYKYINNGKKSIEIEMKVETKGIKGKILKEAVDMINGERLDMYGSPEESFTLIADFWEKYLNKRGNKVDLDSPDVAFMMILFKIARQLNKPKRDNLIDICGYTAILDEIENKGEINVI